jgi:glucose/arabinose dehydrogenase
MLYLALGDGGNGGDIDPDDEPRERTERGNAQTLSTLLGSVLRIDVDSGEPYVVPLDNPFADSHGAAGEIWAYGFRNPYGLSLESSLRLLHSAGRFRSAGRRSSGRSDP